MLDVGVLVDDAALDVGNLGIVAPVFVGESEAEAAVVRTTGIEPAAHAHFEGGFGNPERGSDGQLGQRLALDEVHIVGDEAEAVAHVHDGGRGAVSLLGGKHEAGRRCLAHTDAEEVYLQPGLLLRDVGIDFEHVRFEDGSVVAVEIERVVFEERSAAVEALTHKPDSAIERGTLPVALGTEAESVAHHALGGQSRNLVEALAGLFYVHIAQVVEVGGEALGPLGSHHGTQGEFGLGGIPHLPVGLRVFILDVFGHLIFLEVNVFHECRNVGIFHFVEEGHHFRERHVVYMVAQHLLGSHFVAVGHGHVVHLVAEAEDEHVL